jgi:ribosome maturation factor RimP
VLKIIGESMSFYKKIIEEQIEKKLNLLGYSLVQLKIVQGKKRKKIELIIYSPKGISHQDCTRVSHEILDDPDTEELLGEDYVLEVSSPGINRRLKTIRDFEIFQDREVEYALLDEGKPHFGRISGAADENITIIDYDLEKERTIPIDQIQYAKLTEIRGK